MAAEAEAAREARAKVSFTEKIFLRENSDTRKTRLIETPHDIDICLQFLGDCCRGRTEGLQSLAGGRQCYCRKLFCFAGKRG